jgi:hypothetical protein
MCEDERIRWAKLGSVHKRAKLETSRAEKDVRSAFAGWPALGRPFLESPPATF